MPANQHQVDALPIKRISRRREGEDVVRDASILQRTMNRLRGRALVPKGIYRFDSHEEADATPVARGLKQRKRTILYLTPSERFFYAGFALGEKAVVAARRSGLPASVLTVIDTARKYAEGRAVRLEIRTVEDVGHVLAVAATKMNT